MTPRFGIAPVCGYEVNARGRCHSCGERLVASPLPELESGPDDDEVGYRLDQWDDQTRARSIQALIAGGVLHRFEEEELVILAVDEAEVDRMVARATGALSATDDDDDDDDQPAVAAGDANASRELYEAARHLSDDPTDMQADVALGEASAAVFAVDYLPDLDEAQLAAVGRVTRRLLGALGADEALEDEIRHQAEVLCRLIAPGAGEEAVRAEAARARSRLEKGAKDKGRVVELPQSEVTPGGEMPASAVGDTPEVSVAVSADLNRPGDDVAEEPGAGGPKSSAPPGQNRGTHPWHAGGSTPGRRRTARRQRGTGGFLKTQPPTRRKPRRNRTAASSSTNWPNGCPNNGSSFRCCRVGRHPLQLGQYRPDGSRGA